MQDSGRKMVECGICLEVHQQEELKSHQEMCMVRLVFRCTHCNEDYMNKEGLWNHLELHEITDENKEFNYQEMKTRHKLHQCEICYDQRAYSEIYYWKHVQEVHDGLFLKCSACGECFRNEQLRHDHVLSNCRTKVQASTTVYNLINTEKNISVAAHSNPVEKTHNKTIKAIDAGLPGMNMKPEMSKTSPEITELKINTKSRKQERKQKCPHCTRIIKTHKLPSHLALCENKKFSCEICHAKFQIRDYLTKHMRLIHRSKPRLQKNNSTTETTTKRSIENPVTEWIDVNGSESNISKEDIIAKNLQKLVQNPLKCPHCGKEFNCLISVISHIKCCHKTFRCDICDITIYGEKSAKIHKVTKHAEPSFECKKCSKKFFFKGRYASHIAICNGVYRPPKNKKRPEQNQTNNEQPFLTITDCPDVDNHEEHQESGASTQKETGFDDSASPDRKPLQKTNEENIPKLVTGNAVTEASFIKCSYCEKMVPDYVALTEHFLHTHVPTECKICGITLDNLNRLLYHKKRNHIESKFNCQQCSKKCFTKQVYDRHVRNCGKKTISCSNCGQWFKNLSALERHVELCCQHSNDNGSEVTGAAKKKNMHPVKLSLPAIKCSDCGKEFHGKDALRGHLIRVHQETKCDICGIIIFGESNLSWHKVSKHSEPKYPCPICGKNFFTQKMCDRHYSTCKLKKYTCEICGHKFKVINSLKKHKIYHHPVEADLSNIKIRRRKSTRLRIKKHSNSCKICEMGFFEQTQLDHHMRTKHPDKFFKCVLCTKIFTTKQILTLHEPVCAERKFSCDLCSKKFKLQVGVRRHKRRVHSEEIANTEKCKAAEETQRENSALTLNESAAVQTILKQPGNSDDSQFGVNGVHANYTLLEDENITIKMEIQVEDTMLQE